MFALFTLCQLSIDKQTKFKKLIVLHVNLIPLTMYEN